ncbi:hypothetical protein [Nocardia sp. BMG111209]|uniref:hypothetical protein n=1 Tax=Nocardia sp. BMG111209 TaxID=1160137 RepID=UPI00068F879D|nr:hypothetical protein [Nocardia sp. BMG111209]
MRTYASDRRRLPVRRSGAAGLVGILVLAWLIIGVVAGGQRHYYTSAPTTCATAGTIAVTIIAGPLNYLGMHPTVGTCHLDVPQPS